MLSETEVRVICNGNFGTFLLSTQAVHCHCGRCQAAGAAAGGPDAAPTITPTEFERHSGLLTAKKWRNSIRLAAGDGTVTIGKWLEQHNILPRPKCNGGPLGSPGPGGSGNVGATPFGVGPGIVDGQVYPAAPSSGNDSHTGGVAANGLGCGRIDPASAPALRSTLPPSRYPASEYVTGEEEEYDEVGAALGVGSGADCGGGALGGADEEDDEDYAYGGDGGDGLHGHGGPGRGGRRALTHRGARLALSNGAGSGSGNPRAGPGRLQQGLQRHRSRQQFSARASPGGATLLRRGPGGGSGGMSAAAQFRSAAEGRRPAGGGSSSQENGDGGGDGAGQQGPGGHSSSEGSPPSPSDDSKRRDGSGGSGEGDGSGTGDGGESRLPQAGADQDAHIKQEDGGDPRRVGRNPGTGPKQQDPLQQAQHLHGSGREGTADARGPQDRSARHAATVKRMPHEYQTGPEAGPAAKRPRAARPGGAGADELAALYDAAAAAPQVRGWRFMGPSHGPAADQVLISVHINGRTYTGLLAPQQSVPPPAVVAADADHNMEAEAQAVEGSGREGANGQRINGDGAAAIAIAHAAAVAAKGPQELLQPRTFPSDPLQLASPAVLALQQGVAVGTSVGTEAASYGAEAVGVTCAVSAASAPSGPTASATEVMSSCDVAMVDPAAFVASGSAPTEKSAGDSGGTGTVAETDVPELPDGTAVSAAPPPPATEVKLEETKSEEAAPAEAGLLAALGPLAVPPAGAAEASTTIRQANAGLGPLVEVAKSSAGGGGALAVHSQCALWSTDVFVIAGQMYGVQAVVKRCRGRRCTHCGRSGATLSCCNAKCGRTYHLPCAIEAGALLVAEPFSMACPEHAASLHAHAHQHPSASGAVQGRSASCRAPRPAPSQSVDASQTTTTCSGATATGAGGHHPVTHHQFQPQPQVELPASLQQATGRRISLQAMPPPMAPPPRSVSGGPASAIARGGSADASGLPALMMLRGQPSAGAGGVATAAVSMPPPSSRPASGPGNTALGAAAGASVEATQDPADGAEDCDLHEAKRARLSTGAMAAETKQAFGGGDGGGSMRPPCGVYDRRRVLTVSMSGGLAESAASDATAAPGQRHREETAGGEDDGGAGKAGGGGGSRRTPPLSTSPVPPVFMARTSATAGEAAAAAAYDGDGDDECGLAELAALQQQGSAGVYDNMHAMLMTAAAHGHKVGGGGGGEVSVDSPFLMHAPLLRGMPGGGGRPRHHHHHHHPQAGAAVASASTASGSTATTLCRNMGGGSGGGGAAGDESPTQAQLMAAGGGGLGPGMAHVLPRAARNIEGLLPSRPLLHNPYVPASGDPSADLALSKMAQNGGREMEAELLGGTTGRAGHSGRCAVCVIQRKGKCGTDSAPKKCLRRQLVALQRATGGGPGTAAYGPCGSLLCDDVDELPYADVSDGAVIGGGDGSPTAMPYQDEHVAAAAASAAAEQRARERARRETWSLPLGQGSGATGKRPPQHFGAVM
ncbi:hypothetical protein GPECTOR_25g328 [Gonium pectorale]|uniref:PHD-type domain-containing protein n=1 Tax=Gonium pectorale TaxID=33097 RepID=A0A150GG03_GONPE|nr:hypothetical protein GPECTOR_25g328 [Gonium pectorale]|eukprot:KXZ48744.1 hypothetical protein GPECTOR_25g328 [Gonium pectorale]